VTLKFSNTDVEQSFINVLCYGEAGVGKTKLIGTAPRPLILNAEGGLLSLRGAKITSITIKTRKDIDDVYDWLSLSKEAKIFKTICIDSLSEVAEVLLSSELKETKDPRKAYGVMASEMAVMIRGFRDLPFHTYFTAKTKKIVDEESGAISYIPAVPGQSLLNSLPYFFDEVLMLDVAKTKAGVTYRYLKTVADHQYIAKDRSGRLDPKEPADLTKLFKKISPILAKPVVKKKAAKSAKAT